MAVNFKYDESEVVVYTPATSSCTGTRKMGWEVTGQLNHQKDSEALVSSLRPLLPDWSPLGQVQAHLPTRRTTWSSQGSVSFTDSIPWVLSPSLSLSSTSTSMSDYIHFQGEESCICAPPPHSTWMPDSYPAASWMSTPAWLEDKPHCGWSQSEAVEFQTRLLPLPIHGPRNQAHCTSPQTHPLH